jgi:hypothetical protein
LVRFGKVRLGKIRLGHKATKINFLGDWGTQVCNVR